MSRKTAVKKKSPDYNDRYRAVVIGTSAGGFDALRRILKGMESEFPLPVIVVQHMSPGSNDFMARSLDAICGLKVGEAEEKEKIKPGNIYISPANYHLLVEEDETLALSTDAKVNFCRPSIDVLFDSAAEVYRQQLIGVILTGANSDGTRGLEKIKRMGGLTIVQDPKEAEVDIMPRSALDKVRPDHVKKLDEIIPQIRKAISG